MAEARPLKLLARDVADMDVIAACLQDSLLPVSEMTYQEREGRFVLVANRFMWELAPKPPHPVAEQSVERGGDAAFEDGEPRVPGYRVHSGVTFERVRRVRSKGIDFKDRGRILNLLTIGSEPRAITLLFSDGAAIRLELSAIRCHLRDLGEPWPTWSTPDHALDESSPAG